MKSAFVLAAASVCAVVAMSSCPAEAATAKARAYDCSKPGNASKAACKKPPVPMAPKTVAAAAVKAKPAAHVAAKPGPVAAMAAKPAAKPTAAPPAKGRIVAWTTKTGKVVHYDCSKAGNATKQACK